MEHEFDFRSGREAHNFAESVVSGRLNYGRSSYPDAITGSSQPFSSDSGRAPDIPLLTYGQEVNIGDMILLFFFFCQMSGKPIFVFIFYLDMRLASF